MGAKYTPGDWRMGMLTPPLEGSGDVPRTALYAEGRVRPIALMYHGDPETIEEERANGRLMVASKDLLEALKGAVQAMKLWGAEEDGVPEGGEIARLFDAAVETIRKAEGR